MKWELSEKKYLHYTQNIHLYKDSLICWIVKEIVLFPQSITDDKMIQIFYYCIWIIYELQTQKCWNKIYIKVVMKIWHKTNTNIKHKPKCYHSYKSLGEIKILYISGRSWHPLVRMSLLKLWDIIKMKIVRATRMKRISWAYSDDHLIKWVALNQTHWIPTLPHLRRTNKTINILTVTNLVTQLKCFYECHEF